MEILNPEDFSVFAELRQLRKSLAAEVSLPPYNVFTDAQLAAMVTERVRTIEDLARIEGVGETRLASYGDVMLEVLNRALPRWANSDVAGGVLVVMWMHGGSSPPVLIVVLICPEFVSHNSFCQPGSRV